MTRTVRPRVPTAHHPMVAMVSALALAACAAEGGIAPGTQASRLSGTEAEEPEQEAEITDADSQEPSASSDDEATPELDPVSRTVAAADGFQHYIALGDSFVSGVGASHVTWSPCGTSPAAWPHQVQAGLGIPDLVFAACSGATTQDFVVTGGLKMQPQMSQLPAADALESSLITIGIGGNDIKLDERLQKCFKGKSSSASSSSSACWDLDQLLSQSAAVVAESLVASLNYTFGALRAAAPNATIVAVGYPHLVDATSATCDKTATGILINRSKREKLNELADAINQQIKFAAEGAGILSIVDEVVTAFEGHGACAPEEWIVSADAFLKTGNSGVAHPNDRGHHAYAEAILGALPSTVASRTTPVANPEAELPATPPETTTPEPETEDGVETQSEQELPTDQDEAESGSDDGESTETESELDDEETESEAGQDTEPEEESEPKADSN